LDGIYAFAAWDAEKRRLVAARDPIGVKPFFYWQDSERLVFGSEIKAIWQAGVERAPDPVRFGELLVFRYVAGSHTPELPPFFGHLAC
jgi:asparagine synthase (glutamine-hydrolysing)